jgi:DNA helicase-2/ATP-dependent DNA helicase PcrA
VALHRLATLNYRSRERFAQHKMAVIVPDEGLVRLSRKLLDSLGLSRVLVSSFDKFFPERVFKIIRRLPHKICDNPPSTATYFKRHPALRTVLREFIELQAKEFAHEMAHKIPDCPEAARIMLDETKYPLTKRLAKARRAYEQGVNLAAVRGDIKLFPELEKRVMDIAKDRIDFFMNKDLLRRVVPFDQICLHRIHRHSRPRTFDHLSPNRH